MSKGLSWRQRSMLRSIADRMKTSDGDPVAWREADYGAGKEDDPDYFSVRVKWNLEQAQRRSLRTLERRGLVELGRYCFHPYADRDGWSLRIVWECVQPEDYVPGEGRVMTGVLLTAAGWAEAAREDPPRRRR